MGKRFGFTAEVWDYKGEGSWHFVTVPAAVADEIRSEHAPVANSFGSLPVEATIGDTTWTTSLFRDKASQSYLLPLKKSVRRDEGLEPGVTVDVTVVIAR